MFGILPKFWPFWQICLFFWPCLLLKVLAKAKIFWLCLFWPDQVGFGQDQAFKTLALPTYLKNYYQRVNYYFFLLTLKMPKRRPTTPEFLKKRLDRKAMGLVRDQFPDWVKSSQDQLGEKPRMSLEILRDFIDHLGFHDGQFRNIAPDAVRTTHVGTYQIYDFLRKHLGKHDEQSVPTPVAKAKPKPTPTKAKPETAKAGETAGDQDAVKVEAKHIPGKMEEKDTPYRKDHKEKQSSSNVEPSNSEQSKTQSEHASYSSAHSPYDGENHMRAKLIFNAILDAHVEQPFKQLSFKWHQDGDMSFNIWNPKNPEKN